MKIETDKDRATRRVKHAELDQTIAQLLANYSQFIEAKDIEGVLELFAEDAVVFDLMTPFQYVGTDVLRERLKQWFGGYHGAISYDFEDLRLYTSGNVASAHAIVKCSGTLKDEAKLSSMWIRVTFTLRRNDAGEWLIVHQHTSEPFDTSGKFVQQRH